MEAHNGAQYPALWKQAPPDWRCAACGRDRADVMRHSKKTGCRWSGEIRWHVTYLRGPSPSLAREDAVILSHDNRLIFDGCDTLLGWLRSRESGAAPRAKALSIAQIRRCVDAGPNRNHVLDVETVRAVALEAERWEPAISAYQAKIGEATSPRRTYRYFLDQRPGDWAFAWRQTVDRYRKRIDDEAAAATQERLRCLTALADRVSPLDSGPPPFRLPGNPALR